MQQREKRSEAGSFSVSANTGKHAPPYPLVPTIHSSAYLVPLAQFKTID